MPVRVLGPDGRPVRGLKKGDFVLSDNGQRQVITEFEIHEPPGLSAPFESGAPAAGILPEVNRKYFFVLDMQGSDRLGNQRAKAAVLAFSSAHLQPGDQVCLLTFGLYTGLILRQYLTADMDKIATAVNHSVEMASIIGPPEPNIIEVPTDYADLKSDGLDEATGGAAGRKKEAGLVLTPPAKDELTEVIRLPGWGSAGGRTYADFDMSMSALAKALAYIPGDKIVVYFSTRVPNQSVSHLFADANATIFTVNTNSVPAKGGGAYAGVRRQQKEAQGRALAQLAEASGGLYFEDAAAADTIAREVAEIAGHYYVLGYYIRPSWEGRAHTIKVEVATPGLRVLAQSGYNDPRPFAQWTDIEKLLDIFDLALSDGPVRAEALELPVKILCRPSESEANLAILTRLRIDDRTGLPPGRTEAYVMVFDRELQVVENRTGLLDTASAKTTILYPYMVTRLPPGPYECRVVFREMESGRSATSRQSFRIPKERAEGRTPLICAPPLLLEKTEGTFVHLGKKNRHEPSLLSFYPFWPRDYRPLMCDSDISEISVLLPVLAPSGFDPQRDMVIELLDSEEEDPTPVEWRIIDTRMAANKVLYCLFEIKIENQDRLRIRFTVTDASTKARDSVIVSK